MHSARAEAEVEAAESEPGGQAVVEVVRRVVGV